MKRIQNRFAIANFHGGGILMTTLILVLGYTTPLGLRRFAKILGHIRAHQRKKLAVRLYSPPRLRGKRSRRFVWNRVNNAWSKQVTTLDEDLAIE
jgi:hypothetical protein